MVAQSTPRSAVRLMLRLTTRCNNGCEHCTIADLAGEPDRSLEDATRAILAHRETGGRELVFMRGEVTLLKSLLPLVKLARGAGYEAIQIQTNGRMLAYDKYVAMLLGAGVTFFEVGLYGADAAVHDRVAGVAGAFEQTVAGLRNLAARRAATLVTVPVLKRNVLTLPDVARFVAALKLPAIQFNFPRPVRRGPEWQLRPLVRLVDASLPIRRGLQAARAAGLSATTEGVPLCQLEPAAAPVSEKLADFRAVQVADLHIRHASLAAYHAQSRPAAPECGECARAAACPKTWDAYQALFGTREFVPFAT